MTVLDTNFLIYLLRNKAAAEVSDYYTNPKITTITLYELFFGANLSVKQKDEISKINSLLNSVELLAFDESVLRKQAIFRQS